MLEKLELVGMAAVAGLWLWAWQRFVPRPSERAVAEEFDHRPPASLVFFGLVLFLIMPVFVALPFRPAKPVEEITQPEKYRLGLIASLASAPFIVAGVLAAARARQQPWWTFGVQRGDLKGAAVEGLRVWWEWLPLVAAVNALARHLYEKRPEQFNPVEAILRGDHGTELQMLAATAAVLRAPLVEELVFRGLFQTWFNVFTAWPGLLCAAIVFAAVHSDAWPDPVPLVLVGIMLGLAYQRTRNLVAPVVAHALFNGFMTALALLKAS